MTDDPLGVRQRVVLTPAEKMLLIEQSETLSLAMSKFRSAVEEGRTSELLDLFYDVTAPYEYIGKVLATKIQKAMMEAAMEARDE